jgi:pilus assembly protein Flp/PilA
MLSQANWEISMNKLLLRRVFDGGRHLLVSEDGPTAVEYAVMLALIVVVCLGTITTIGTSANGTFNTISTALPAAS